MESYFKPQNGKVLGQARRNQTEEYPKNRKGIRVGFQGADKGTATLEKEKAAYSGS